MDFEELFTPGAETTIEDGLIISSLVVRGELSGLSTPTSWDPEAEEHELSEGAISAWGRDEGYAMARLFLGSLAQVLGGSLEFHTRKLFRASEETHTCIYKGPEVVI